MEKPKYAKIIFPARQKDFSAAIKKYFGGLRGGELVFDFSQERRRKQFKYKVVSSEPKKWYDFNGKLVDCNYEIVIIKQ